jgi:hypothetical protein
MCRFTSARKGSGLGNGAASPSSRAAARAVASRSDAAAMDDAPVRSAWSSSLSYSSVAIAQSVHARAALGCSFETGVVHMTLSMRCRAAAAIATSCTSVRLTGSPAASAVKVIEPTVEHERRALAGRRACKSSANSDGGNAFV